MNPAVDLFVINYNGGDALFEALDSVVDQTYVNKRVILSDNESTKGDPERVRERGYEARGVEIRVRKPGSGHCYAHYNVCLPEAQAPYVGIFHNDDVYAPDIVAKQVGFLEAHPALDAVVTAGTAVDPDGRVLWPIRIPGEFDRPILNPRQVFEYTLRHGNSFFVAPSALFRTEVFRKLGALRAELPYCGDLELFMRILFRGGGIGYLDEPLIRYRISTVQGSSVYERTRVAESEFFRMMDEYLKEFGATDETREAYEALRELDLFQAGLNRLARDGDADMFLRHLENLRAPGARRWVRRFGAVDRLKLAGAAALAPWARGRAGRWLARQLIERTDPRATPALAWALKAKRALSGLRA
jgi:GT2 family glycosyltransferase